jgi:hypothetical protein
VAEGGGLLNRYRLVKAYRGFESLRLRQLLFFRGLAANWRSKIAPQMPRLPSMITVSVGTTVRRQHSRSWPFLFELKGIPAQYGVDIKRAIEMGGSRGERHSLLIDLFRLSYKFTCTVSL